MLVVTALWILTMTGCASGEKDSTANRTKVDLSTPKNTCQELFDAVEAEDAPRLRATLDAQTAYEKAFADDFSLLVVTTHRYRRVATKTFPDAKVEVWVWHDDIRAAREALRK